MTDEEIRQTYIGLSIRNDQNEDTQRTMRFLRTRSGWNLAHTCSCADEVETIAEVIEKGPVEWPVRGSVKQ